MPPRVRRALTAADVQAAVEARQAVIAVPAHVRITPLARDLARDRGVALEPEGEHPRTSAGDSVPGRDPAVGAGGERDTSAVGAGGGPGEPVEAQVRRIVTALLEEDPPAPAGGRGRVRHVPAVPVDRLPPFPHPGPAPGQDVRALDVVSAADGSPMAAGFLTLTRGEFPWRLDYDEIQYVVEGELHVTVPEGTVVGRPGDVLYVPKGTSITFGTPTWARFLYVTFPADWETAS